MEFILNLIILNVQKPKKVICYGIKDIVIKIVKYIHKLQNLYYEIENKELELK